MKGYAPVKFIAYESPYSSKKPECLAVRLLGLCFITKIDIFCFTDAKAVYSNSHLFIKYRLSIKPNSKKY